MKMISLQYGVVWLVGFTSDRKIALLITESGRNVSCSATESKVLFELEEFKERYPGWYEHYTSNTSSAVM